MEGRIGVHFGHTTDDVSVRIPLEMQSVGGRIMAPQFPESVILGSKRDFANVVNFFLIFYLFIFRERGREGERE